MEELKLNVRSQDVGYFYELMVNYKKDPEFLKLYLNDLENRKDTKPSLYRDVINNCTCGACYKKFARNDRVPWRHLGANRYVNAKHGIMEVSSNCIISDMSLNGYIYASKSVIKKMTRKNRSGSLRKHNIETSSSEGYVSDPSEDNLPAAKVSELKTVVDNFDKDSGTLREEVAKYGKELESLKSFINPIVTRLSKMRALNSKYRDDYLSLMDKLFEKWEHYGGATYKGVVFDIKNRCDWPKIYRRAVEYSEPIGYMALTEEKDQFNETNKLIEEVTFKLNQATERLGLIDPANATSEPSR